MSTTSKSPRKVILTALAIARASMTDFSHRNSPKTFTQPQLFACIVLKTFCKTDYRGICIMLADLPDLVKTIGLRRVPHFTTLQKAARRLLLSVPAGKLLDATIARAMGPMPKVKLAAVDSSGLESRHISRYFVKRRSREAGLWQTTTYTRYPKMAVVCDCANHLILSVMTTRGPTPDINQLTPALAPACRRASIATLLADAGYDSEANHVFVRESCGIHAIIPPKYGRPTQRLPSTRYRREMATSFNNVTYGQRWQVETVFSMIKRNLGEALKSRTYWSQNREMNLLALTHNIMVLLPVMGLFYRAGQEPFIPRDELERGG